MSCVCFWFPLRTFLFVLSTVELLACFVEGSVVGLEVMFGTTMVSDSGSCALCGIKKDQMSVVGVAIESVLRQAVAGTNIGWVFLVPLELKDMVDV